MYIPPHYVENSEHKLVEFMHAHNFATLISTHNDKIQATHLPFVIEKRDEKTYLVSHMAKANSQWNSFMKKELLVIFQGPHAYISPAHYEKKQNVPTWNYIAVHAYGIPELIVGDENTIKVLENMINSFEPAYYEQWKQLAPNYVNGMIKEIVAFEIEVNRLEGKFKLSQNKTKNEQQHIIHTFEKSDDQSKIELAK